MSKLIRAGCISLILFFMPQSLYAAFEDSSICDESIARAAQESTVPRAVLMKIARLESGRKVDALIQQAKAPENFVLGALAALRLLDVVSSDREIRGWMMRARGVGDGSALRHAVGTVVGILVSALSRSETLALAMQARGFAAQRTRTHYRQSRWTLSDTWWVIGGAAMGVLSVFVAVVTGAFNAVLA